VGYSAVTSSSKRHGTTGQGDSLCPRLRACFKRITADVTQASLSFAYLGQRFFSKTFGEPLCLHRISHALPYCQGFALTAPLGYQRFAGVIFRTAQVIEARPSDCLRIGSLESKERLPEVVLFSAKSGRTPRLATAVTVPTGLRPSSTLTQARSPKPAGQSRRLTIRSGIPPGPSRAFRVQNKGLRHRLPVAQHRPSSPSAGTGLVNGVADRGRDTVIGGPSPLQRGIRHRRTNHLPRLTKA